MIEQANYIQGLREIAKFYEDHPETPLPYEGNICPFTIFDASVQHIAAAAKAFGKADKIYGEDHFELVKTFPSGIVLRFWTSRENVCEKVVVGTKLVPEVHLPAVPAKDAYTIPAKTEEVVEWRCKPIMDAEPVAAEV